MHKRSRSLLVGSIGFVGCANATDPDSEEAEIGGAPKQLEVRKADGIATAKSTDAWLLNCQLDYEAFKPTFPSGRRERRDHVWSENTGAFAADASYQLAVTTNPDPPYNLSFIIDII